MSFIKTLNGMGYAALELDVLTESFVKRCHAAAGGHFLDVGSGFGIATVPVANAQKRITTCDIAQEHLDIIRNKIKKECLQYVSFDQRALGGDLTYPPGRFDAILVAMVLHFFTPQRLTSIMESLYQWLKPGGQLFVTVSSPYQGTLTPFLPLYHRRKAANHQSPGVIEDISKIIPNRAKDLPRFNHVFDIDDLTATIRCQKFSIEKAYYFTRSNLPSDIALDGREYVGVIAEKVVCTEGR